MGFTKATGDYIDQATLTEINAGIDWQTTPKTSAFTAVSGEGYLVDTTSAAITVTLPTSPAVGDEISILDYVGTANTNNITIASTDNINGSSDDVKINYTRGGVAIIYTGSAQGWVSYSATNETATALGSALVPLAVDYLVVAGGGGGGGSDGGGGGAGGLRTSYTNTSSLNGHTESSLSLNTATNYTVTVGSGGAGGIEYTGGASSGQNSVFDTVTSTGGGAGGSYSESVQTAQDGGSGGGDGGGGTQTAPAGSAVTSPVTQGYGGGSGQVGSPGFNGGGGGGANGAGGNSSNGNSGDGGPGLNVAITGSNVYYAGGGGGGGSTSGDSSGGIGGGGAGKVSQSGRNGDNGTPNTGGGGGAGDDTYGDGGSGGSGIVIIRYPDYYDVTVGSGLTTGTLNTAVGSGEKYTTFTAGTGSITFGAA